MNRGYSSPGRNHPFLQSKKKGGEGGGERIRKFRCTIYSVESQLSLLGTVGPRVLLVITLKAAVFKDILNFPRSQDVGF